MQKSTVEKAVSFFYPFFQQEVYISFFGGEPLLIFDTIQHAVNCLQEKKKEEAKTAKEKTFKYTLTTNGSLLTDDMITFFNSHRFKIALSFDGLTQDSARKPGTFRSTLELIPQLASYPDIILTVNCVCTPDTVSQLAASVQHILENGAPDIQINFDETVTWQDDHLQILEEQLEQLCQRLTDHYQQTGAFPVSHFQSALETNKRRFVCIGGQKRISISPEEDLWGCVLFHPYLKNKTAEDDYRTYSFGKLDDFIIHHADIYPRILSNYNSLKQESFFTEEQFCFLCEDVEYCRKCPPYLAFATSFIGKIPTWSCRISRLLRKQKEQFQEKIKRL